ncbi:MAG TPA: non-ribosomal peptide synthetase [Candidatus Dormibacteraeota bacterium]|nr:non-ribosomal peptide synthetase [Candidatus Dormibacteraeota bacterium]
MKPVGSARASVAARPEPEASRLVHELVSHHAATSPNTLAVTDGDGRLTYADLDARSNRLAHRLVSLRVARGDLVAVCIERSADLVITLLGILKAGAVYVPLDPTYPRLRLTGMLEDSGARILITRPGAVAELSPLPRGIRVLDIGDAMAGAANPGPPNVEVSDADLAYVIYTSGSTGRPKGVEITHSGLLNLVRWHQRAFAVTASDRATHVSSPAFDATGWEIWPYLTAGASVHVAPEDARVAPALMRDWLVERGITVTFLPTPVAERILALDWPPHSALRLLLAGGDTLHVRPPSGLPYAVINNYGPTETTVVATSGIVPAADSGKRPTIGRPIDNTEAWILDEDLRPTPAGVPGELYIGGAGVARGYHGRPDLTAQRFIANPFDSGTSRLYRTGDLAAWTDDGEIEFLGRVDLQVKIRGFRIELDEIAHHLNRHPGVQVSAVAAREDEPGEKQLVAYVVPEPGTVPDAREMRAALGERLPEYMIPAAFVVLDALPLTPNGKVDRAALPAPAPGIALAETTAAEPPRSPVEERVGAIVSSLLRRDQVGMDDNFFLLGGNSLMGAQLVTRIAEVFKVDVPLRVLFATPNVRQLAAEVELRVIERVESMTEDEALRELSVQA